MAGDINRVTLVGRLTRDPELKHLPSGTPVLEMGVAVNGRQQDDAGNWVDKPNFFDVKVFGNQAEMLSQHLTQGPPDRHRRPARLALVGGAGRQQALEGRRRRAERPVPRQPPGRRGRRRSTSPPARPRPGERRLPGLPADDDIPF